MNSAVKIKCVSPKINLGDVSYNASLIVKEIEMAHSQGVDVLLFPELSLCGYTLRDMLGNKTVIKACEDALKSIMEKTKNLNILSYIGMPVLYMDSLYSCMVAISGESIISITPKSSYPKKSPFGEIRVFDKAEKENSSVFIFGSERVKFGTKQIVGIKKYKNVRIGCVLGNSRENISELVGLGATVILNPTADPVLVNSVEIKEYIAKKISYDNTCTVVMCNAGEGESSTDAVFAPHNIIAQNGKIIDEALPFESENGEIVAEIDVSVKEKGIMPIRENEDRYSKTPFLAPNEADIKKRCELILKLQAHGLARRLVASYSKYMLIGISGGLDSTLALMAMVECADYLGWDRKSIIAITMPCFGTTERTKTNAIKLCEALGVDLREINIFEATRVHLRDIGHSEEAKDVTYENAQARERTQILMDVANKVGGLVVGTGDLSEASLGWSTYNGDHMSMYGLNCDIPKTLVRQVVGYCATKYGGDVSEILLDILDTPVSPELLPANDKGEIQQKTEDLVGPYDLHDFFLYNFVGRGLLPSQLYKASQIAFSGVYDDETIDKWLRVFIKKFVTQQFKRSCTPDGVKVCSVSLSPRGDFNMPSDMSYKALLEELDKNK